MMAAAVLVMGVVGLGVSEASGLTKVSEFVATVLRIRTADGTLVVKVDDPNVKVEIDGDTVVIGGAGPQEVRSPRRDAPRPGDEERPAGPRRDGHDRAGREGDRQHREGAGRRGRHRDGDRGPRQ